MLSGYCHGLGADLSIGLGTETQITSFNKQDTPKETFNLFGRIASSTRSIDKTEKNETIYTLTEEKNDSPEEELITEEILNIPAYQRRK